MNHKQLALLGFIGVFFCSTISLAGSIPQTESDAARISMLEQALAPDSPDALATLFATANKNRNAAVQFMLFSDQLKNKYKDNWPYWVSGTSSPWITSFTIKKNVNRENAIQFQITYQWATADGPFSPPLVQTIIVEPVPKGTSSSQKYWITRFSE
ncbi:hypothetical protein [uncultured Legionella sp.]|uniref:hypothetical protein n=1 Tax=uncultured Legionella sp. TaxID=210934 RepID=UPI00260E4B5B|nr:hypothetical protein [uncultured Legionella sp.]